MKKIKLLSLFSGIGAFEKALNNIGQNYELINYCEIDKYASYAYSVLNNVDESLNLGDISKIDITKLEDFDLLTHGSPCQSFSLAGKGEGGDEGSGTKSSLMWYTVDIIRDKMPKFVIWENVKAVICKKHKHNFDKYINTLDKLGYNSYFEVLNSKDYGAPQSRERVFVISIRKDIDTCLFKFLKPIDSAVSINDILDEDIDKKYYCINKYTREFIKKVDRKVVDNKEPNKYGLLRVGKIENPTALNMNKRVFSSQGACPTILTSSHSVPKIMEYKLRRLTPCECWKATGFTQEDYWNVRNALELRFYNGKDKSDSKMYKMAGNSIVVNVLEHILKELFKN
ncbi:TPA: DNA cytosine methyltransferase [Clostridium botulinum]|uniref:DNA cytosine methyltransferase n=1 Tax=Clostridium botulinum TaxID=1491 RepID=UPI000909F253|nr:DNA (cytosine-5-)-methyltransferase [Clostridium botulinum]APC79172.1 DNA (cytosine-5-)-methyltransferase family protein [Clostridium botulinum]MCS4446428.1 DNA cytosine methyltransferase [Clostridium botulinum]MCS4457848.1 DNA cytosine methyltransferase [Clostridium botulinum]MCS4462290.1 DNA cytosine methyltransferase [Clostridium botulinum]MCS4512668.1 DNA cytosine methyltransferase [Clostridium botulinum]